MEKLFFLAFVAFCNPFGLVAAKKYEFHYLGTEAMNETNDFFSYEVKSVDKFNESVFIVNVESDLKVVMNNDWHITIEIFHKPLDKEEFGEKPFLTVPKKQICEFWSTTYKERFWDKIKDYSNLPAPDACPIDPDHFVIKDYPFDISKYTAMARPGEWLIKFIISQDHDDVHVTKFGAIVRNRVDEVKEE